MDKRFQIFVSSTYADLKEERQKVIQALMEMDCIPSGMELFPAADEEQWEFIKKIIDDCDYYLLIIGGRYGSTTSDGISYTEKEYDYAIDKGIKVIALIHSTPEDIPAGKTELDPELRERLQSFRSKVSENRLVKFWKTAEELPGLVALSLSKTIKTYPAVGWVRADNTANPELLSEINNLRKRNEDLEALLATIQETPAAEIPNLASIDDVFNVYGKYTRKYDGSRQKWEYSPSWRQLFGLIAPYLLTYPSDSVVKSSLKESLFELADSIGYNVNLNDQIYQSIKIQLMALNLVKIQHLNTTTGGKALFWSLTRSGQELMMSIRSVKKNT